MEMSKYNFKLVFLKAVSVRLCVFPSVLIEPVEVGSQSLNRSNNGQATNTWKGETYRENTWICQSREATKWKISLKASGREAAQREEHSLLLGSTRVWFHGDCSQPWDETPDPRFLVSLSELLRLFNTHCLYTLSPITDL